MDKLEKKSIDTSMELTKGLLKIMTIHSIKCTQIFIEAYEKQLKLKNEYLSSLLDEEPPKFFKKAHSKWQNKIDEISSNIENLEKKLYDEYSSLGEDLDLFNS